MLMSGLALLGCLLTANPAHAEKFALIYSGGGTRYSNASYFGERTLRVWRLLVNRWGYAADNVYVLFADGTDPALDCLAGAKQADTDWSEVVRAGGRIGSQRCHPLGLVKCGQKIPVPVSRFCPNGRPNVVGLPILPPLSSLRFSL